MFLLERFTEFAGITSTGTHNEIQEDKNDYRTTIKTSHKTIRDNDDTSKKNQRNEYIEKYTRGTHTNTDAHDRATKYSTYKYTLTYTHTHPTEGKKKKHEKRLRRTRTPKQVKHGWPPAGHPVCLPIGRGLARISRHDCTAWIILWPMRFFRSFVFRAHIGNSIPNHSFRCLFR